MSSPSQADLVQYNVDKSRLFKTTISLAAVYGVIAFIFLMFVMIGGENANSLANELLPFTITLIGGMMFVLIILVVQIVTFKPVSTNTKVLNDSICPDYWKLEVTDTSTNEYKSATPENQPLMKYRCVPDTAVWDLSKKTDNNDTTPSTTLNNAASLNAFQHTSITDGSGAAYIKQISVEANKPKAPKSILTNTVTNEVYNNSNYNRVGVAAGATSSNIRCDVVYPMYMANKDAKFFPDNPNLLRCEYAKQCKIPWTGVCPWNNA